MKTIERKLIYAVTLNSKKELEKLLDVREPYIDILFDEGKLFGLALSRDNTDLARELINYYKKMKIETQEGYYKLLAIKALKEAVIEAIDRGNTPSSKMKETLGEYYVPLDEVDDSDTEGEYFDEELHFLSSSDNEDETQQKSKPYEDSRLIFLGDCNDAEE